jgi:hypothetical protein
MDGMSPSPSIFLISDIFCHSIHTFRPSNKDDDRAWLKSTSLAFRTNSKLHSVKEFRLLDAKLIALLTATSTYNLTQSFSYPICSTVI